MLKWISIFINLSHKAFTNMTYINVYLILKYILSKLTEKTIV